MLTAGRIEEYQIWDVSLCTLKDRNVIGALLTKVYIILGETIAKWSYYGYIIAFNRAKILTNYVTAGVTYWYSVCHWRSEDGTFFWQLDR